MYFQKWGRTTRLKRPCLLVSSWQPWKSCFVMRHWLYWLCLRHLCTPFLTFSACRGCFFLSHRGPYSFRSLMRHCTIATHCRAPDQPHFAHLILFLSICSPRWTTQASTVSFHQSQLRSTSWSRLRPWSRPWHCPWLHAIFSSDQNGDLSTTPSLGSDWDPNTILYRASAWRSGSSNRFSFLELNNMYTHPHLEWNTAPPQKVCLLVESLGEPKFTAIAGLAAHSQETV